LIFDPPAATANPVIERAAVVAATFRAEWRAGMCGCCCGVRRRIGARWTGSWRRST